MDRLRNYSLLKLMTAASRSAAYTGPERRKEDRGIGTPKAGAGNANVACRERDRFNIATEAAGGETARLKPMPVGTDPMGRPVVMPYIADGAWPADGLAPVHPEAPVERGACPDFSSTVVLASPLNLGGSA